MRAVSINKQEFMTTLKRARYAKGLSQQQVARKVGVTQSTVGAWEAGENLPRPVVIPKLARVLGIDAMDLTRFLSPEAQIGGAA